MGIVIDAYWGHIIFVITIVILLKKFEAKYYKMEEYIQKLSL